MSPSVFCPCGSQRPLADCCEPYLQGTQSAPTAEALMRSRYTAYCLGDIDYLIATHHPAQRSPSERTALNQTIARTTWLGLSILSTDQGQPEDAVGIVEFVVTYRAGDVGQRRERSRFKQQKGRWLYVDGEHLPPLLPKRNEPCWCGSGKRFKQCHGRG